MDNHIDVAVGCLSPNAGHTFYINDKKYVTKLLPVAGILNDRTQIYLSADSVINEEILLKEMKEFDINDDRLIIHPRASVIRQEELSSEKEKSFTDIASTQSGTGYARSSKILRINPLVQNTKSLQKFIDPYFSLEEILKENLNVLVETSQGIDLGLNHGFSYPYCTSKDVLPASILSELGLHPKYLGNVMLIFRTYPIRVGNPKENNKDIGFSGPVYDDSKEVTWEEIHQEKELTTVTKRVRRVFTFSEEQYKRNINLVKPSHIFINFANYLDESTVKPFEKLKPHPTCFGFGNHPEQIYPYEANILKNFIYKWR